MLKGLANRVATAALLLMCLSCPALAGAGGSGGGGSTTTTTTTTSTTTIDKGNVNGGTIYNGNVTVSGAMNATLQYVWGNVNATAAILGALQAELGPTANTALNFYRNAVGALPSNYELLAATAPTANNFLYYEGSANGFQFPTDITDGSNALGIELEVIGGRTYQWSETVSGPTNHAYALSAQTTNVSQSTQVFKAGDVVVATNINTLTEITNFQGTANVSVYQVDAHKIVSPIILDMKGGRMQPEASGGNYLPHPGKMNKQRMAAFDFNANGFEELMEWVGPDDGLLVEPKPDGSIDGSCLFGTTGGWTNGYEKLSLRDANHDGKISGEELNGLQVWQDRNGNARVDSGEVRTVADLKITEIGLLHTNYMSTFTMNGSARVMWDWWPSALHVRKVRLADALKDTVELKRDPR